MTGVQTCALPISAFVIGAAIGAKNTIYDYLSGLIIAVEKPVRVGDCIEVEDQRGFVTEISGRYTVIRRFDGIDVLVPNSTLLEENVINWTLRDHKIRGDIKVGISYEMPVRKASNIIRQAIKENEEVLEQPSPGVIFWRFGESSFILWAWFWTDVENPLNIWYIESEIRFRIVELLQENQITIAYPQRDVHLDTRAPLSFEPSKSSPGKAETLEKTRQDVPDGRQSYEEVKESEEEVKPNGGNSDSDNNKK